jgi:AcrR family transcriptional regulator
MSDLEAGLRQRKKQRTRRALADAAARLVAERGYEETTIADLAAAADISPRTFFSYFPAKEDALFADLDDRIAALSQLEFRRPGEGLRDGIRRVASQALSSVIEDTENEETRARQRTIASQPSLQAAALLRLRAAERVMAGRLHAAYPEELDPIAAAAVVGAFMSAVRAAGEAQMHSRVSAGEAHRVIDRVWRLLEPGLDQ